MEEKNKKNKIPEAGRAAGSITPEYEITEEELAEYELTDEDIAGAGELTDAGDEIDGDGSPGTCEADAGDKTRKKRKLTGKVIALRIMLVISILAVVISGAGLGLELYTNWQSESFYSDMVASIETRPREPGYRPRPTTPPPTLPDGTIDPDHEETLPADDIDDHYDDYDDYEWTSYVDFDALNVKYPGVVGWIKLDGTHIDYPVMRRGNNDYYLTHWPDGTRHRSGSIYMDYRNKTDFSDKNTLIYGHESRTKEMFGSLKDYRNQTYYNENPVMYIYTPDTDYELVIFAAYTLDSGKEVPPMSFRGNAFENHIKDIKSRSFIKSDVEVGPNDRIVSLCTCAYDFTNARLIVVGKLIEF